MLSPAQLVPTKPVSRWKLARAVVYFQVKLALDGLKDLALMPLSIAAGVLGIISSRDRPERLFQRVLKLGRGYDDFVDLYSQADHLDGKASAKRPRLDAATTAIESVVDPK